MKAIILIIITCIFCSCGKQAFNNNLNDTNKVDTPIGEYDFPSTTGAEVVDFSTSEQQSDSSTTSNNNPNSNQKHYCYYNKKLYKNGIKILVFENYYFSRFLVCNNGNWDKIIKYKTPTVITEKDIDYTDSAPQIELPEVPTYIPERDVRDLFPPKPEVPTAPSENLIQDYLIENPIVDQNITNKSF